MTVLTQTLQGLFINICEKCKYRNVFYKNDIVVNKYLCKLQYKMNRFQLLFIVLIIYPAVIFSQELKIMTWNIFMVPPIIFKSCQTERAYLIADYIKNENADILVLEEAFMKKTRNIIYDSLKNDYPYQSTITKRGFLKTNSGIWILSKYPIHQQQFIKYKKKKGTDIFAKKGAVLVDIQVNGKQLQIVGTHTQSLVKYKTTRALQFQQLKTMLLDKYRNDSIPQFIIGDLNCDYYDTTEYNSMITTLETLPVSFTGEKHSWNGLENDLAYKFSEHTLETLDYILLRKQHAQIATILSTTIVKPYADTCYCKQNFRNLSDHHPVIANIILK